MITADTLSRMLHALSTGYQDRALNLVLTDEALDEDERRPLYQAIQSGNSPHEQARALGDTFLSLKADQAIINECYRAAFYTGEDWAELSTNPLYAHFLANRSGAVLDKWVHYFPIYTRHLDRFRGRPVRMLEIGVYRGGGLDMWSRYLGPDAKLVGLDIDEAAVRAVRGRFPVVLGDQADPEVLLAINEQYGPFDVVIDDGGHTMRQQIVTAETLFPLLNDGGVFLVEDTHTSYWSEFGGALRGQGSFIEWAKDRVDDLHSRHDTDIDPNSVWATELDGIHLHDSVVVLEKKHRFRPFNEVVGSSSYLFAERFSEVIGNELLATRDAALRERDLLQAKLDGVTDGEQPAPVGSVEVDQQAELTMLRTEIGKARKQLAELDARAAETEQELVRTRNDLLESWQQVKAMRRTVSWRVTAPLRAARGVRGR
ncbi:MAG TPA: class I SAM-dependent methyltransferase [Jatrophihabitans sp.]|nr:class I SAM-dependent methyltransferase [Jatrophihabitans sp.]